MSKIVKSLVLLATVSSLASCGGDKPIVSLSNACNLEGVDGADSYGNNRLVVANGRNLIFRGWLADIIGSKVPNKILVSIISEAGNVALLGSGEVDITRPDVADAFKNPALAKSGFAVNIENDSIVSGAYTLQFAGVYEDKIAVCQSPVQVVVE